MRVTLTFNNKARFIGTMALVTALTACGSGSDPKEEIEINATLDEGTSYVYEADFGAVPIVLEAPENGELSVNATRATYTPEESFFGADSARIEGDEAIYVFSFTVNDVNQAPVFESTSISVVSDRVIEGTVLASDPDGDVLTFELISPPERGEFTLDSASGEFRFEQADLRLPNASFVVAISDGENDPVQEVITLLPGYESNEEKAAYYYHSEASHLSQAELRINEINSDLDTNDAYTYLAEGYVLANLSDEVQRILDDEIVGQQARAVAKRLVANRYAEMNQAEDARQLRVSALQEYTEFVVSNGVENLTSSDSSFYLTLLNNANDSGDVETTNEIAEQLQVFVDALGGGEYGTPFGRLTTAYRNQVNGAIEQYELSGSDDDRQVAIDATIRFADVVEQTGYQLVRNGENAGERLYQLAPFYNVQAADFFFQLGDIERAKRSLAVAISYYTEVDYDPDFARPAQPYAAVTRVEYLFPMADVAGLFALLYPELETNVPLTLIPADDIFYARAVDNIENAEPVNMIAAGESVTDAIQNVETTYADDSRDLMLAFADVSEQLYTLSYTEAADAFFESAMEVLASEVYFVENQNSSLYTTGARGCNRLIRQAITQRGEDAGLDIASSCNSIFMPENRMGGTLTSVLDAVNWYLFLGVEQGDDYRLPPVALLRSAETLVSEFDGVEQADGYAEIAALAAAARSYDDAIQWADNAYTAAEALLENSVAEEEVDLINDLNSVLERIDGIDSELDGIGNARSVLRELRSHAYNESNYATMLSTLYTQATELAESLVSLSGELTGIEQFDVVEAIMTRLASVRAYSRAESVLASFDLGAADRLQMTAFISQLQALQDDFPASIVATVDTDQDGLANFYSVNASAEQLANTEIQLDDDADGDGVVDELDPCPLGC